MINNHMDTDKEQEKLNEQPVETRPNESTGIYVRGFLKITDPESGQVVVETGN
jgi:hypothetical protein